LVVISSTPKVSAAPDPSISEALAQAVKNHDPGAGLRAIARAYSEQPIAERLSITVEAKGRQRQSSVIIRWDPATPSREPTDSVLRLDLERIQIIVDGKQLTAISREDPSTYVRGVLAEGVFRRDLERHLPPLPIPQLDFISGPDRVEKALSDWLGDVQWTDIAEGERRLVVLRGIVRQADADPTAASANTVTLAVDRVTGRLRSFEAPRHGGRISIIISAVEPGDPSAWRLDVADRREVAHIGLFSGPPPRSLIGERLPDLGLLTGNLEAVKRDSFLPTGQPAIVVLFRASGNGRGVGDSTDTNAKAGYRAASEAIAAQTAGSRSIAARAVGSLPLGGIDPVGLEEVTRAWNTEFPAADANGAAFALLWSPSGGVLLDRVSPRTNAAILVVDREGRIRNMISLDHPRDADSSLVSELRNALIESGLAK
jgi:hypothetical protein